MYIAIRDDLVMGIELFPFLLNRKINKHETVGILPQMR